MPLEPEDKITISIEDYERLLKRDEIEEVTEIVTITLKEYEELLKRDEILTALEAGGVDNWEWYDEAIKEFKNNN